MKTLNRNEVKSVEFGHIRCDGTCNLFLELNDTTIVDLFGLTMKQCKSIETWFEKNHGDLKIDDRFLVQTEDLWLSQNGIK